MFVCLLLSFISIWVIAQENGEFNSYFRSSNLYTQGQSEVKVFNAIYTQRTFDGFETLNSRGTFFSAFGQFLFGTNRNYNYGFDLVYKSNITNDDANSSPFDVLRFQKQDDFSIVDNRHDNLLHAPTDTLRNSDGTTLARNADHGLAHIGAKIKFSPFKKWSNVSIQQTMYIPLDRSVDGSWISYTQWMYDKQLSPKTALYAELGMWTTVAPNFNVLPLAKAFFSYFPNKRWTVYAMTTVPVEYGLGSKFLITPNLEVELLYTYFLPIDFILSFNRPVTYNLGVRYTNW